MYICSHKLNITLSEKQGVEPQLNGNKIVLKFYLSEMLENPYRKGSYRQMTLKTEEFIYKINDNNHWEQANNE